MNYRLYHNRYYPFGPVCRVRYFQDFLITFTSSITGYNAPLQVLSRLAQSELLGGSPITFGVQFVLIQDYVMSSKLVQPQPSQNSAKA